jgi:hypothetical protein
MKVRTSIKDGDNSEDGDNVTNYDLYLDVDLNDE